MKTKISICSAKPKVCLTATANGRQGIILTIAVGVGLLLVAGAITYRTIQ